jgi:ubiquinone/menaquinone biosynthesis C-methylase UbiE
MTKKRNSQGDIIGKAKLEVKDSDELRAYYEKKYAAGGYEAGCTLQGVNISEIYHQARLAAAMRQLAVKPGERILDAGCGNGVLAARIADKGAAVDAIDIASNAQAEVNKRANISFQQMNVEQLAYADNSFDKVVMVETLEHVLRPELALKEVKRVLKPGGQFVLTYPTINRTVLKKLGMGKIIPISEHLNEWDLELLEFSLYMAGLTKKDVEGVVMDLGPLNYLKLLGPWWARNITKLALSMRWWPANSTFISIRTERLV